MVAAALTVATVTAGAIAGGFAIPLAVISVAVPLAVIGAIELAKYLAK